jgi:hypothetical protein
MKLRHVKRRARPPDFRLTKLGDMVLIEVKSAASVARFFGPTKEEDDRSMQFFKPQEYLESHSAENDPKLTE